jgi:hypothetical protein
MLEAARSARRSSEGHKGHSALQEKDAAMNNIATGTTSMTREALNVPAPDTQGK